MVTDQNHSSDSTPIEQEVSRYEKITKRIADMDSALSEKMGMLDEKMDNYYSEYKKSVKRLEKDIRSLKVKLEDLDECVDRKIVVDSIHKIVSILINEKSKDSAYLSESSEDSDLVKIIERSHGYRVREERADQERLSGL
jgi:hypothetical protein